MGTPFRIVKISPDKSLTLGRHGENDFVLKDISVSRFHAKLFYENGSWVLENRSQTTGTFLNGKEIQKAVLARGDSFTLGLQSFRIQIEQEELSLLHVHLADHIHAVLLKPETVFTLGRGTSQDSFIGIDHAACPRHLANVRLKENKCEISFKEAVKQNDGKKRYRMTLAEGESIKLPWCVLEFQNSTLTLHLKNNGFEVCVQHLSVCVKKKELLKNIGFSLPPGKILAVMGRSGQGKSTLLHHLIGNIKGSPDSVFMEGSPHRQEEIRKQIAFLPQEPLLRDFLTVRETLLHHARLSLPRDYSAGETEEQLLRIASLLAISHLQQSKVSTLSGGEKRRTALAASLMGSPGLILLDEPLSGLDSVNAEMLCAHFRQLAFLGHTIIFTTHSYKSLEIADEILLIHRGEPCFYGSPEEALLYFKTSSLNHILTALHSESGKDWDTCEKKETESENGTARPLFPQVKHKNFFFYTLSLLWRGLWRDKGRCLALFLQPLFIGFLLFQTFTPASSLWVVAFALILCANWFAFSHAIREFAGEKALLSEEWRQGMKILPILSAKTVFPFFLSLFQTILCYFCLAPWISLSPPYLPALGLFAACLFPAVTLGLLTSALAKNLGQASAFLPLLIIPQVALTGILAPIDQMRFLGRELSFFIWSRHIQTGFQNLFTEIQVRPESIFIPLALGFLFYIITLLTLFRFKKAK
ncbi:MAG: ATP-binding cassette domain-containing protein [Fibrobacter sp.]|jgi:ABC-type multidrug transport system ATPase subunit|nr:ATP-binding cassette domain-containing protein [Fibrobacter sp.]